MTATTKPSLSIGKPYRQHLRDDIAIEAMKAALVVSLHDEPESLSKWAYTLADAMMRERDE